MEATSNKSDNDGEEGSKSGQQKTTALSFENSWECLGLFDAHVNVESEKEDGDDVDMEEYLQVNMQSRLQVLRCLYILHCPDSVFQKLAELDANPGEGGGKKCAMCDAISSVEVEDMAAQIELPNLLLGALCHRAKCYSDPSSTSPRATKSGVSSIQNPQQLLRLKEDIIALREMDCESNMPRRKRKRGGAGVMEPPLESLARARFRNSLIIRVSEKLILEGAMLDVRKRGLC